jgi:ERCC4 domain
VPIGDGLLLRTSGTWPRTKALYCHPMAAGEWPPSPEIVERVPLRSCVRRGAAIDLIAARNRESRSQIVFTIARGREVVFWQSPRTRKQARPQVRTPTARAAGIAELEVVVDVHERYAYGFGGKPVRTVSRALPCGDYGVMLNGRLIAAVERKSLADLTSSLTTGKLRYAVGELAALPRGAVVVEDRYSGVFRPGFVRPSVVADGLAELQVRWPGVPVVFCETRALAEEWTYRYLGAAFAWASTEAAALERITAFAGPDGDPSWGGPIGPPVAPSVAEVRAWARAAGLVVPDKGRLRPEIVAAWEAAHRVAEPTPGPAASHLIRLAHPSAGPPPPT